MKNLRYVGTSHVRELSREDLLVAFGMDHAAISADKRVDRGIIEVSNRLADKLIETGEWLFVSDGGEDLPVAVLPNDEPMEPVAEVPQEPVATTSRKGQDNAT